MTERESEIGSSLFFLSGKTYRSSSVRNSGNSQSSANLSSLSNMSTGSMSATEQICRLDLEGPILPDRFLHLCQSVVKLQQWKRRERGDEKSSLSSSSLDQSPLCNSSLARRSSLDNASVLASRNSLENSSLNNSSFIGFSDEDAGDQIELEVLCQYPTGSIHSFNFEHSEEFSDKKEDETNTEEVFCTPSVNPANISWNFLDRLPNEKSILGTSGVIQRLKCVSSSGSADFRLLYQLSK
jgi:hypothetical protein